MKASEIGYCTEIVSTYAAAIRKCRTKAALLKELRANWKDLCPDAIKESKELPGDAEWLWALSHARKAKDAKRVCFLAGAVLCPMTLMQISELANHFSVPDGCAYIRMREQAAKEGNGG